MATTTKSVVQIHYDGKDNILGMSKQLARPTDEASILDQTVDLLKKNGFAGKEGFYILEQNIAISHQKISLSVSPFDGEKIRVYMPYDAFFEFIQDNLKEYVTYVLSDEYSETAIRQLLEKQNTTTHISFPLVVSNISDKFLEVLYEVNGKYERGGFRFSNIGDDLKKTPNVVIDSYLLDSYEQRMRTVPNVLKRADGTLYYLPDVIRRFHNYIVAPLLGLFSISKTALLGRAGAGKTAVSMALADHYGLDYVYVNMTKIQTPSDLFGRRTMKDGTMLEELTPMTKALLNKTNKGVVIALDEINRVQTELLNPLLTLLGEQHMVSMGDGTEIPFEGNRPVIFIITGNVGGQYVGTDVLDPALISRLSVIVEMEGISADLIAKIMRNQPISASVSDEQITKIAKIVALVSDKIDADGGNEITTRHAIDIIRLLISEIDMKDALGAVLINKQDISIRSGIEEIINMNL